MPKRYAAASALALVTLLVIATAWWLNRIDPAWQEAADWLRANRDPQAPTLIIFPAESPAQRYDAQLGLRGAVSLNIGWRDHSDDELARLASALACQPQVWALWPVADSQAARMHNRLLNQYNEADHRAIGEFVLIRFDQRESSSDCLP